MSTVARVTTADELLNLPRDEARYELVRGDLLTKSPSGSEHGVVIETLKAAENLDGRTILPGFRRSVAEIFTDI